jgi:hypothetical protein
MSETMTPLMGSTGWLGHQPMTLERRPCWLRMFQIALVLRPSFEMAAPRRRPGSGSAKPWMPCLKGRLPVAMLVQSIGESTGCRVVRLPMDAALDQALHHGHPARVHQAVDGLPVGGVPADALAEKVAALQAHEVFTERAARADRARFLEVLDRLGNEHPGDGDDLP